MRWPRRAARRSGRRLHDRHRRQARPRRAFNNRALVLMRRGQLVAAERDLRRRSKSRPDLADIGFNLANALQDQGRVAEAVDAFRATLAKVPATPTGHGMMLFCADLSSRPDVGADLRRVPPLERRSREPSSRERSAMAQRRHRHSAPARRLRIARLRQQIVAPLYRADSGRPRPQQGGDLLLCRGAGARYRDGAPQSPGRPLAHHRRSDRRRPREPHPPRRASTCSSTSAGTPRATAC